MAASEYTLFRDADGCGWITGTVWTGPRICAKTARYATDHQSTVNGRVCGAHANKARRDGAAVQGMED